MKHYGELTNITEMIIHILYAGYICDYYQQCLNECNNKFGKEKTKKAKEIFELNYKSCINIIL